MSRYGRWTIFFVLLLATVLRCVEVWHPVDGRTTAPTRESDVAGIARNFYGESMNLFQPRIDWRGDGPGYVESEFPIYAWLGAACDRVLGYREEWLRVISLSFSVASLAVFLRLAQRTLPTAGVVAALLVYAVNPLDIRLATAIQPEPLMYFFYLLAVSTFVRWTEEGRRRDYWLALGATTAAILAKLPAAHIGVLFAGVCLMRFGLRAALRRDLWFFIVTSIGIPLGWYAYARSLYLEYGNSLGISNEAYVRVSSLSFLESLKITAIGNWQSELEWIWTLPGIIAGLIGLGLALRNRRQWWLAMWVFALGLFYVVAGRTTGEDWAAYYHIVSLPAAALLIGNAVAASLRVPLTRSASEEIAGPRSRFGLVSRWHWVTALALCGLLGATVVQHTRRVHWNMAAERSARLFRTAMTLREQLTHDGLIVASGGSEVDQFGLQRAANSSYYFFWTGRRGFTLHEAEQSLGKLEEFRRRGATYFIAERNILSAEPGFEQQLRQRYPVLAEGEHAVLFELRLSSSASSTTKTGDDDV